MGLKLLVVVLFRCLCCQVLKRFEKFSFLIQIISVTFYHVTKTLETFSCFLNSFRPLIFAKLTNNKNNNRVLRVRQGQFQGAVVALRCFKLLQLRLQGSTMLSKCIQKINFGIDNYLQQNVHNSLLRSLDCIDIYRCSLRFCLKPIKYTKKTYFYSDSSYICDVLSNLVPFVQF